MANILLIEPNYSNKYPPLGLMKISTYHKLKGDTVVFCKGEDPSLKKRKWDRIYVTTLFTFYWKKSIETIQYYYGSVVTPSDLYVGGVMATLLGDDIANEKKIQGITISRGLLDKPGMLGDDDIIVDLLAPDYTIVRKSSNSYLNYEYPTSDSYIAYSSRGCVNKCAFCAVPIIEPEFKHYISLKEQVDNIKLNLGIDLKNLLIMDNNILASDNLKDIIHEIIDLGYGKDNNHYSVIKDGRKTTSRRYVDFNQGTDARLLNDENMELISKIAIKPLRIAFDHANEEYVKLYESKVRLAADKGIKNLSNYVLYNFTDTPIDLYRRLKINIKLNEEFENKKLDTKVFSFPMRYSPIKGEHSKDRKYVGVYWSWKFIRAVQCILQATHGVVSPNPTFFYKAFGKDEAEFERLLYMPNDYIMFRLKHEADGRTSQWLNEFEKLNETERVELINCLGGPGSSKINISMTTNDRVISILKHYK